MRCLKRLDTFICLLIMKHQTKRFMWQFPWGYKESIAFVLGLLFVGFLLQLSVGNFNYYLLHFPANVFVGIGYLLLIVGISSIKKNPIVNWLSSVSLSVTLIAAFLILSLSMGLIPQVVRIDPDYHIHLQQASFGEISNYVLYKLGFKQVTESHPFVLIYGFLLLVLGLVIAKRFHRFKWSDYGFYLNHLGLWLFLFAAGLGAADRSRHVMYVEEGEFEWRVFDEQENMLELDIAIELHDFIMEEYSPKLAVINKYTGDVQPEQRPAYHQIDDKQPQAELADWEIRIDSYIHEAVRETDTTFQAIPMLGSMPAAKVSARNKHTHREVSGWVTCGSVNQYVMPLDLDSTYSLVMTKPEAKRFASEITVMAKNENIDPIHTVLEVNSPLRIGSWMIYQYDYDHTLGKASQVSGFELVYDPWLLGVYLGILFMGLGSISMLWVGNKKERKI